MVKNTKTCISWERNIIFLRNKKILNLLRRWHILRRFRFVAEVTFKEVIPHLLWNGFNYVLSGKFCQNDLENYFGFQRAIGRTKSNPTVYDTGYNNNTIKAQYSLKTWTGNVRGEKSKWNVIDTEPYSKYVKISSDACRQLVECRHLAIICVVKLTFLITFYVF